jgi:hypothetical protein
MINLDVFQNLLRNKQELIDKALNQDSKGFGPEGKELESLALAGTIFISLFGLTVGLKHSVLQGVASAIKLPVLFVLTSLICFPTLFIFQALLGMKTSIRQLFGFMILCLAISGVILLSFIPVTVFFLISGTDYEVFKIINVGILAIAGSSGLYIFRKYLLRKMKGREDAGYYYKFKLMMNAWFLLFGCIGANLGFIISPVFGMKNEPFILFTDSTENFFSHLFNILIH